MRIIVCLSGGKASAYCAKWALDNYPEGEVILYFNDTKWEHLDLYRFLDDLSAHLNHPITNDSDGRTPESVFWDVSFLGNNQVPVCSKILKAERLQAYCQDGDVLIFGIGLREYHRSIRIQQVYQRLALKRGILLSCRFPIIEENVEKEVIDQWLHDTGIREPELYRLGFKHNNCSGGCVRSGKRQWIQLLKTLPDVYADRERCEADFKMGFGKEVSFLKDTTLKDLREKIERDPQLGLFPDDPDEFETECVGICNGMN